jgi:alkanesulfonate monooxygenase SsuD/methylene tetrahydromethanopterin reductase-like flavin-dependent oxidoreductase (luciferase family)
MTTLGCIATAHVPPGQFLPLAQAADEAGLDEIWLWEDCFYNAALAATGAILASTTNLRVGLGVLPVPLRNVALTAMEFATLEGMFPGRLIPGVGHGVLDWMGQAGVRVASPITLLREHIDALRALLRGERVTVAGRYVTLTDVGLNYPLAGHLPVLGAAVGPKTHRLVGEVADGLVISEATAAPDMPAAIALAREGWDSAGREGRFDVVKYVELSQEMYDAGAAASAAYLDTFAKAGATSIAVILPGDDKPAAAAWLGQEVAPLARSRW